jgi:pimeloyl-ACP methyl ester carboxylesterase
MSTMTTPGTYASVNGLQLYYETHGTGRPLVLLHGGLLTIELTFSPILPSLAQHHQVIAVELQGHGRTADTDRAMSINVLADDVAALLDQLGIAQADVFGFSLGGFVALELAMRRPELVGKLVLASVSFRQDGYHDDIRNSEEHPNSPRMPTAADFQLMQDEYERLAPDPGHFAEFAEKASTMVGQFEGWSDDELRATQVPTLILLGDTDFLRLDHAIKMFELMPNAQLAVLPDTTHMGVTRSPNQVLALVEPFLVG